MNGPCLVKRIKMSIQFYHLVILIFQGAKSRCDSRWTLVLDARREHGIWRNERLVEAIILLLDLERLRMFFWLQSCSSYPLPRPSSLWATPHLALLVGSIIFVWELFDLHRIFIFFAISLFHQRILFITLRTSFVLANMRRFLVLVSN